MSSEAHFADSEILSLETHFIRHGKDWDISLSARQMLIDQNKIAIHYDPIASVEEADYQTKHRSHIKRWVELGKTGGLIVATFPPKAGFSIGVLPPNSETEFLECEGLAGRRVVLKSMHLQNVKRFSSQEACRLLAVQPQRQTFCRWTNIGKRAQKLYDYGSLKIESLEDFLSFEQEVLCAEFLRSEICLSHGLRRVKHLLFPVGRTLPDVDIVGLCDGDAMTYAQVTFKKLSELKNKVDALKQYAANGTQLVMFCNTDQRRADDNIIYFPLHRAMRSVLDISPELAKAMGAQELMDKLSSTKANPT